MPVARKRQRHQRSSRSNGQITNLFEAEASNGMRVNGKQRIADIDCTAVAGTHIRQHFSDDGTAEDTVEDFFHSNSDSNKAGKVAECVQLL